MNPQPPRTATALLRHFGPQDDALAGDLLEGFHRRSGSRMWYCWQVAIALRVEAVREISRHPIGLPATVVFGWVVWWVLLYQIAKPVLFATVHAYFMWRIDHGYNVLLFGPFFVGASWVIAIAAEAVGAIVTVRAYRGHRPMLALLYAGAVLARTLGGLTLNSIYHDPAASTLPYRIGFPPLFGIGTFVYIFPTPSLTALVAGTWATSLQERSSTKSA